MDLASAHLLEKICPTLLMSHDDDDAYSRKTIGLLFILESVIIIT